MTPEGQRLLRVCEGVQVLSRGPPKLPPILIPSLLKQHPETIEKCTKREHTTTA